MDAISKGDNKADYFIEFLIFSVGWLKPFSYLLNISLFLHILNCILKVQRKSAFG